ncbi:hypothetical protein AOCH_000541 [Aspergillus ochraceoroseus]|uniref:Major facilitator superfamily (MFS) profile domain-containing protein n=2 Tax=Aspergillus ochraceoroseus TaxID=138278 RepID=A0A0F8UNW7_9EURO|nr:hypothetical protein AOCH_000541 [Aspergillus ochraceoroseus]
MNHTDTNTQPDQKSDQKTLEMGAVTTDDVVTVQSLASGDIKNLQKEQHAELEEVGGSITRNWSLRGLIIIWISALLMNFVVNLNNQSSSTFLPYATSSFGSAPLLGTIAVVQATIVSVSLQPLARFADVYGRFEMFSFCILMATIGEVMVASSTSISVYAGAQVFWVLGLQGISLMLQILAGDSSDLSNRALMNAVPYIPSLITAWTAAPFATSILKRSWRWGFGVFAILVPVVSAPLLASLYHNKRKASKERKAQGTYERRNHLKSIERLDPVGLVLFAAGLSLLLVPITLAATATNSWKTAHIIVMLVVGFVSLVAFVVWEIKWAKYPLLSMSLFKRRSVIFGITAMLIDYIALYLLQNYITTYELVAGDLSVTAATNIAILIPFSAVFGQLGSGLLVKYIKRYKWIVVCGFSLNLLGLGLTYKYVNAHSHMAQLIISQIILGFGEGVINTTQFGMQAAVSQAKMAAVTALFTTSLGVGSACGGAIGGGVWTALLPRRLRENLPPDALSQLPEIEGSIVVALGYPWGTPERDAINESYTSTFRTILLIALILEVFALAFSLLVEDLNIRDIDNAREYNGVVFGKSGAVDALKGKIQTGQAGDAENNGKPPGV